MIFVGKLADQLAEAGHEIVSLEVILMEVLILKKVKISIYLPILKKY